MKRFVTLSVLVSTLAGCGGDDSAPPSSAQAPATLAATSVAPLPDQWAALAGTQLTTTTVTNPFAAFDFKGGTAYPAKAAVSIGTVKVPVGATEAFVPIRLNHVTPNTVIVRVMTRNGSGTLAGTEGIHYQKVATTVIFRPGDPLEQTVRIPLLKMDAGRTFSLFLPEGAVGSGGVINNWAAITAVAGATQGVAKTAGFRPAKTFAPTGTLAYQLDPATVTWNDAGGADTWRTRLSHGRTQPGNAETGLYLDPVLHQSPLPPFAVENGEVVIRSQQLLSPILYDNTYWYKGAAILTGQRMPATQLQYGQYEWTAMMPNRRGGWPALWLLPVSGAWPPEIDVYEGFGYSSGWNFATNISSNIHGGSNGTRTFTALMQVNAANTYALSGFDSGYHRYAVDVAPDYITWFVDGKETYQTVNPFKGTTWYPLMNVAVKQTGDYVGGTAEMRVRSFAVWKVPG